MKDSAIVPLRLPLPSVTIACWATRPSVHQSLRRLCSRLCQVLRRTRRSRLPLRQDIGAHLWEAEPPRFWRIYKPILSRSRAYLKTPSLNCGPRSELLLRCVWRFDRGSYSVLIKLFSKLTRQTEDLKDGRERLRLENESLNNVVTRKERLLQEVSQICLD